VPRIPPGLPDPLRLRLVAFAVELDELAEIARRVGAVDVADALEAVRDAVVSGLDRSGPLC